VRRQRVVNRGLNEGYLREFIDLLKQSNCGGGEGGIRTHVPVTRQHAFEARPLRPLRYLSGQVQQLEADL
jgi:hypothetical protein